LFSGRLPGRDAKTFKPAQLLKDALAATNKSLAQSNKSEADGKATKQRKTEHIEH